MRASYRDLGTLRRTIAGLLAFVSFFGYIQLKYLDSWSYTAKIHQRSLLYTLDGVGHLEFHRNITNTVSTRLVHMPNPAHEDSGFESHGNKPIQANSEFNRKGSTVTDVTSEEYKLTDKNGETKSEENTLASVNSEVKSGENALTYENSELRSEANSQTTLHSLINSGDKTFPDVKSKFKSEDKLTDVNNEIKRAENTLADVNSDVNKEIKSEENKVTDVNSELKRDENKFMDMNSENERDDNTLTDANSELERDDNILTDVNSELKRDENTLTNVNSEIKRDDTTLTDVNSELKRDDTTLTDVNSELKRDENTLTNVDSEIKRDDTTLTDVNSELKRDQNTLTDLNSELKRDETTLTDVNSEIKHDENTLTDVNSDLKRDNALADVNNEVKNDENTLTDVNSYIKSEENKLSNLNKEMKNEKNSLTDEGNGIKREENQLIYVSSDGDTFPGNYSAIKKDDNNVIEVRSKFYSGDSKQAEEKSEIKSDDKISVDTSKIIAAPNPTKTPNKITEVKPTTQKQNAKKKKPIPQLFDEVLPLKPRSDTDTNYTQTPLMVLFSSWAYSQEKAAVHAATLRLWSSWPFIKTAVLTSDPKVQKYATAAGWEVSNTLHVHRECFGPPVLAPMFTHIMKNYQAHYYGFSNSDIMYGDGLADTLKFLHEHDVWRRKPLLIVGRRHNVDFINSTDIAVNTTKGVAKLSKKGTLVNRSTDFFFANKHFPWSSVPEVTIGRPFVIRTIIAFALQKKIAVLDATKTIEAVHLTTKDGNMASWHVKGKECNKRILAKGHWRLPLYKGHCECALLETFRDNGAMKVRHRKANWKICH